MTTIDEPLQCEFSLTPNQLSGWENYVISFKGIARGWDDDLGDDVKAGLIQGQRIDLAAAHYDQIDRAVLLESISPEIADFTKTVHDLDGRCPSQLPVKSRGKDGRCPCLIYIEAIEVEQELRGQDIGTGLLRRFSEVVEVDNCLIGLKAFPLSRNYGEDRSKEAIERIKHFYERLGYVRGPQEYMLKDASQCKPAIKRRLGQS